MYYYFFFFSSRRRHTSFDCDWSSDVCSSDLLHLEHRDAVGAQQVCGVRVAAQGEDRGMLEQQEQVVRQAAGDAVRGEAALPLQGFTVRHEPRRDDFENALGHRPPAPGSPLPAPCIAHRLPAMPSARLAHPQALSAMTPPRPCATSARKPTINAPTPDSTPMATHCHTISSARLRRQPKNAASTTPARRPTSNGSPTMP